MFTGASQCKERKQTEEAIMYRGCGSSCDWIVHRSTRSLWCRQTKGIQRIH